MRFVDPPLENLPERERPDELDQLLRAFYQAEMPKPWPACPRPRAETVPMPVSPARSRWVPTRSRFALAASVGLLVVSLWSLSGKFSADVEGNRGSPVLKSLTADTDPHRLKKPKESLLLENEKSSLLFEFPK